MSVDASGAAIAADTISDSMPGDSASGVRPTIPRGREAEANSIVSKYAAFGFGGGVIPFPLMDVVAVSGIQIKMLSDLAKLYEVEFVDNWGKSLLSSLAGGATPHVLAFGTVGSLVKAVPVLGSVVGFAVMPILSAASTYAVGKVFVQHFESGGTFLDFDVPSARAQFDEQFTAARSVYKRLWSKVKKVKLKGGETPDQPNLETVAVQEEAAQPEPSLHKQSVPVEFDGNGEVTQAPKIVSAPTSRARKPAEPSAETADLLMTADETPGDRLGEIIPPIRRRPQRRKSAKSSV